MIALAVLLLGAEGPISKFDDRPPVADYKTAVNIYDVERCLIDMEGWRVPNVQRQPDRPDESKLIWFGHDGLTKARLDLKREGSQTHVRAWIEEPEVKRCAPPL